MLNIIHFLKNHKNICLGYTTNNDQHRSVYMYLICSKNHYVICRKSVCIRHKGVRKHFLNEDQREEGSQLFLFNEYTNYLPRHILFKANKLKYTINTVPK